MTPSRKARGGGGRQAASPPRSAGVVRRWGGGGGDDDDDDDDGSGDDGGDEEEALLWPRGLSFHQEAEAAGRQGGFFFFGHGAKEDGEKAGVKEAFFCTSRFFGCRGAGDRRATNRRRRRAFHHRINAGSRASSSIFRYHFFSRRLNFQVLVSQFAQRTASEKHQKGEDGDRMSRCQLFDG